MCLACSQTFDSLEISRCPLDGTALIRINQDPLIGQTLMGRYRVKEIFAKGHAAMFYLLEDLTPTQDSGNSLLRVLDYRPETAEEAKKFARRAHQLLTLNHASITRYKDAGINEDGQGFAITELAPGKSLTELNSEFVGGSEASIEKLRWILQQLAAALRYAHEKEILHGQLHPGNVIVEEGTQSPGVKLTGFYMDYMFPYHGSGLSCRVLDSTAGEASMEHTSPEQCMGNTPTPASDVYTFGMLMFYSLTGKIPFKGTNAIQSASKHMTEEVPGFADVNPSLVAMKDLELVTRRCLEKDPAKRYQSMRELLEAL